MVPGDSLDNDCDGQIDEEIFNNKDDDGDGKVDEDLEEVRRQISRLFISLTCNNENLSS